MLVATVLIYAASCQHRRLAQPVCLDTITDAITLHPSPAACRPMVGVVAPVTSRGKKYGTVAKTPYIVSFVQTVFATLAKSKDAGYDVVLYVGYDEGDSIWDSPATARDMPRLLQDKANDHYSGGIMGALGLSSLPGVAYKGVKCKSKSMVQASNCVIGVWRIY